MAGSIFFMFFQDIVSTGVCGGALPAGYNGRSPDWNTYRIFDR